MHTLPPGAMVVIGYDARHKSDVFAQDTAAIVAANGGHAVLLPAQAQPIHYLVIAFNVRTLQVIQQTPSLRDHFQQAAPRMIVLLVSLEMLSQLVNSLTQQCYLNLRRTGVGLMGTEVRHDLFFGFFC